MNINKFSIVFDRLYSIILNESPLFVYSFAPYPKARHNSRLTSRLTSRLRALLSFLPTFHLKLQRETQVQVVVFRVEIAYALITVDFVTPLVTFGFFDDL